MLKFYDIDEGYVKYLQKIDRQVPNIGYTTHNKFVCGTVLDINGVQYYAPISSNTQIQKTNLPICDKQGIVIATIRFCFMFPAVMGVLTEKNFRLVNQVDKNYADLLATEYDYCTSHEQQIKDKALAVYRIGCNKNHKYNYTCCDFKKLEEKFMDYFVPVADIREVEEQIASVKEQE